MNNKRVVSINEGIADVIYYQALEDYLTLREYGVGLVLDKKPHSYHGGIIYTVGCHVKGQYVGMRLVNDFFEIQYCLREFKGVDLVAARLLKKVLNKVRYLIDVPLRVAINQKADDSFVSFMNPRLRDISIKL